MGSEPLPNPERGASCRALTALFPQPVGVQSSPSTPRPCVRRVGWEADTTCVRWRQSANASGRAQAVFEVRCRLLLQAARPREFTFATLSQDCIAVPRHLYELQPTAAPQVAGATQMSTRRPGYRLYFPENPKWRHVLKRKKNEKGGKSPSIQMKLDSNEFSTCSLGKVTTKEVRYTSAEHITTTPIL